MVLFLYKWLFLFAAVFCSAPQTFSKPHAHPFYVSVTEVGHNKAAATLEISCKLFAEDAQAALEHAYKTKVDFGQAQQTARMGGLVNDYVQKHLSLQVNSQARKLQFAGFEMEAESLYCYFEVTGVPAVTTIALTNSLLYDFSDKQINIMHVLAAGTRKSYKLDYPDTQAEFRF